MSADRQPSHWISGDQTASVCLLFVGLPSVPSLIFGLEGRAGIVCLDVERDEENEERAVDHGHHCKRKASVNCMREQVHGGIRTQ